MDNDNIKKINESELNKILSRMDANSLCSYCKYDCDCDKSIACYGDVPIYPPCYDDKIESLIDVESFCESNNLILIESEEIKNDTNQQ